MTPEALLDPDAAAAERAALEELWRERPGFAGWLASTDHKSIGRRFIVTAFVFFAMGGILALLMRLQLAQPEAGILGNDLYDQIFTMHGTNMMFLFAVPVMLALGVYFVPLMVGARNMALPRLLAFGYWMFLFGGIFLWAMFFLNVGPDNGWFNYPPLSGPEYGIGKRSDVWSQFITFSELSALVVAICIIVTVLKLRAPGMALNRIPLYVWTMLIVSLMIVFAMPAVMVASTCLILDRLVGTHFFNQAEGGDPLLWQHLFWFFGHPEVYIIFLPALGMISAMIETFTRRPVFGYLIIVLATVSTAFIGFGVWVHHMFATGLPQLGQSFFTVASMMIVVPTGAQIFCWIATLWSGRLRMSVPLLYVLSFFFVFLIGGLTGVMQASVVLDQQVHDTFFIVAHLHYVLIGGALFPLLGAVHYWFPKVTGRRLSDFVGYVSFGLLFAGFNLTFFPMHILGLMGMPRRVYTYPASMGWGGLNLLASIGAAILTLSLLVYLVNVIVSLRLGARAGDNPWEAASLEWATSSPPPAYNFSPLPTVSGRSPLWERPELQPVVVGLGLDKRRVLVTRLLDAEPDHRRQSPEPSLWPFLTAIAVSGLFIGSIFNPWAVVIGAVPVFVTLVGWFWPHDGKSPDEMERAAALGQLTPREEVQ
jgi:cytochrome c oxidase subunit 1